MAPIRLTRRDMVRMLSMSALATSKSGFAAGIATRHQPIGVQLYTVRQMAERDLPGTLAQIRAIGYQEVETYWNVYTRPAAELRKMITDHGLRVPSGHFDYDGLGQKFDYARELGVRYMVCPMLPENMWSSVEGFQKAAEQFNKWGENAQSMGMQFAFHNHDYEFLQFGDTTGFDTLMARTDPRLVSLEMDCYWMTQAGQDPVAMLRKYKDRIHLLHLKDRKPGFPVSHMLNSAAEHFTEVGSGSIDWKKILAVAKSQGIRYYFVEQDTTTIPVMESLKISYRYLHKILV